MGLIRILLSLAVIITHTAPLFGLVMTGAALAFMIFFVLSGFYMALILSEKYTMKGAYPLFIGNRLLRLYPIYWIALICSVLMSLVGHGFFGNGLHLAPWFEFGDRLSPFTIAYLVVVNIIFLGQPLLFFANIDLASGAIVPSVNPEAHPMLAWTFLVIAHSWTLDLEIVFYLLVPFLVKLRTRYLLAIMAASLGVRLYLLLAGFPGEPWMLRFFPSELCFFVLGMLAYRFYTRIKHYEIPAWISLSAWGYLTAFIVAYQFIPGGAIKETVFFASMLVTVPYIFNYTKYNKRDRWLGELTYPVYIAHRLFIPVFKSIMPMVWVPPLVIVVTVLISIALNRLVTFPLERFRQRRVAKACKAG
jgi:peptidoglycan/LPS O-acetylase OafA/YrhL